MHILLSSLRDNAKTIKKYFLASERVCNLLTHIKIVNLYNVREITEKIVELVPLRFCNIAGVY